MIPVISDTSPIRYLIQIDHIDLLQQLFENILVPEMVAAELLHPSAPQAVQAWMKRRPGWVSVLPVTEVDDPVLRTLDPGERAAIVLGLSVKADLIIIDDRRGASIAEEKGFETIGTLGLLDLGAERGLIVLGDALGMLKRTNFRYRQEMLDELLSRHQRK